nr:afadin- and alpha-actinin-binding protein B-like [Loxodonta africana]
MESYLYKDCSVDGQQKCFKDLDSLRGRQGALQVQVQICQQKIAAVQAQEQELEERNKGLCSDLDKAWQEVKRLQQLLISQKAQYDSELKRKEKELGKLKERVQEMQGEWRNCQGSQSLSGEEKLSQEKVPHHPCHPHTLSFLLSYLEIDILNNLKQSNGKQTTWKIGKANSKKEGELFQTVVRNLENQVAAVSKENEELRQLLTRLDRDVVGLLGCPWDSPTVSFHAQKKADIDVESGS